MVTGGGVKAWSNPVTGVPRRGGRSTCRRDRRIVRHVPAIPQGAAGVASIAAVGPRRSGPLHATPVRALPCRVPMTWTPGMRSAVGKHRDEHQRQKQDGHQEEHPQAERADVEGPPDPYPESRRAGSPADRRRGPPAAIARTAMTFSPGDLDGSARVPERSRPTTGQRSIPALSWISKRFSSRETCIWDSPTRAAICAWVRSP